jgi:LytS/YehU family sensor histidine kinase
MVISVPNVSQKNWRFKKTSKSYVTGISPVKSQRQNVKRQRQKILRQKSWLKSLKRQIPSLHYFISI